MWEWETRKAHHHKMRNIYFKFEPESVSHSQCTSLTGDLDSFGGRLGKFSQQNVLVTMIQWLVKHMVYTVHSTMGMDCHHINGWIEKEKQGMGPDFSLCMKPTTGNNLGLADTHFGYKEHERQALLKIK